MTSKIGLNVPVVSPQFNLYESDLKSFFSFLPEEITLLILSHIHQVSDFYNSSLVCKQWKRLWDDVSFQNKILGLKISKLGCQIFGEKHIDKNVKELAFIGRHLGYFSDHAYYWHSLNNNQMHEIAINYKYSWPPVQIVSSEIFLGYELLVNLKENPSIDALPRELNFGTKKIFSNIYENKIAYYEDVPHSTHVIIRDVITKQETSLGFTELESIVMEEMFLHEHGLTIKYATTTSIHDFKVMVQTYELKDKKLLYSLSFGLNSQQMIVGFNLMIIVKEATDFPVIDLLTGNQIGYLILEPKEFSHPFACADIVIKKKWIALITAQGSLKVWMVEGLKPVWTMKDAVTIPSLTKEGYIDMDEHLIITAGFNSTTVKIWDILKRCLVAQIESPEKITSLQFKLSTDDEHKYILIGTDVGQALLYQLNIGSKSPLSILPKIE